LRFSPQRRKFDIPNRRYHFIWISRNILELLAATGTFAAGYHFQRLWMVNAIFEFLNISSG